MVGWLAAPNEEGFLKRESCSSQALAFSEWIKDRKCEDEVKPCTARTTESIFIVRRWHLEGISQRRKGLATIGTLFDISLHMFYMIHI
jgi:hypothetical protein